MYIPRFNPLSRTEFAAAVQPTPGTYDDQRDGRHPKLLHIIYASLTARDDPTTATPQNTTIIILVTVLVTVFLAGFFYFLWRYHRSIRVRRKGNKGRGGGRVKRSNSSSGTWTFGSATRANVPPRREGRVRSGHHQRRREGVGSGQPVGDNGGTGGARWPGWPGWPGWTNWQAPGPGPSPGAGATRKPSSGSLSTRIGSRASQASEAGDGGNGA
ncbi:hypothetical protein B0J18DRAFT_75362 [Chaetomium sp. MPI-SDFR-AT-0129]|nr:hypothetical protein B0J18DRAFT_75362 [Chaetomium sp. MPI-SDFR-AT-0129]